MSSAAHNPSCPCMDCVRSRKLPPSAVPAGPNHLAGCPCTECRAVREAQAEETHRVEEAMQSARLTDKRHAVLVSRPPRRPHERLIRTIKLDPFARVHPWHELYRQQADPKLHERTCVCYECEQMMTTAAGSNGKK